MTDHPGRTLAGAAPAAHRPHRTGAARRRVRLNLVIDAGLLVFSVLMILPLIFLVSNGFKTSQELLAWPPRLIPENPTLENFRNVLSQTLLPQWIFNSVAFATMSMVAIVTTSTIAGYILGKFRYRSLDAIFMVILATAIVPFEVYMIPLYFQVQDLGLLDSIWGLTVGYLVMSFGIFLVRQNVIHAIPDELLEAARIDGAGEIWIFFRVVVPLLRGALGALAVLAFFQSWTAFAWPMIVTTSRANYTIEVGLALFQTGISVDMASLSAASAIVLVPSITLFAILRRNFVQSIASTGLKE